MVRSPPHLENAVQQFQSLQFRSAFEPDADPSIPSKLRPRDQETLLQNILLHPHRYVAQHPPELSVAPVFLTKAIKPQPVLLRKFTCNGPNGIEVMPGGLTRILPEPASPHSSPHP